MDRRTFNEIASLAAVGALAEGSDLEGAPIKSASRGAEGDSEVILQDREFMVAFDATSGALTRFKRMTTQWKIERRPELAASFRLLAPLPHRRDNFVLGEKQHATKVVKVSEHEVQLQWKNLLSEHGGVLPITFDATVTLEGGAR